MTGRPRFRGCPQTGWRAGEWAEPNPSRALMTGFSEWKRRDPLRADRPSIDKTPSGRQKPPLMLVPRLLVRVVVVTLMMAGTAAPGEAVVRYLRSIIEDVGADEGAGFQSLALGDVDGDGDNDLAVVISGSVSLFKNDGNGQFEFEEDFGFEGEPFAVQIADMNGDRRPDLVVVSREPDLLEILLQDAEGSFSASEDLEENPELTGSPIGLIVADLNRDRRADVAVLVDAAVLVFRGLGNGLVERFPTFSVSTGAATSGSQAIASGDVNGDGNPDLAVSSRERGQVSVLLGRNDGSFQNARVIRVGEDPAGIAMGDFLGDSAFDDIAVINGVDIDVKVTVLESDGSGGFQPRDLDFAEEGASALVPADLDGDGKLDLLVGSSGFSGGLVEIYCRQPSSVCFDPNPFLQVIPEDEGFQKQLVQAALSGRTAALVAGQLNRDTLTDFLALSDTGETIRVYLNAAGTPVPEETETPGAVTGTPGPSRTPTISPTPTIPATPTLSATPTAIPTLPLTECNTANSGAPGAAGNFVSIATADFDRDGNLDFVGADLAGNRLVVFPTDIRRLPAATACQIVGLPAEPILLAVESPVWIEATDLDPDGRPDIVVLGQNGTVSVFYGSGDGRFERAVLGRLPGVGQTIPGPARLLSVSDLNSDGRPDILAALPGGTAPSVFAFLRNRSPSSGQRNFCPPVSINAARPPVGLMAGDLNNDGLVDLAILGRATTDFTVLLQQEAVATTSGCPASAGEFRGLAPFGLPGSPSMFLRGQLERGDVIPDLVVALTGSGTCSTPGTNGRVGVTFGRPDGTGEIRYSPMSTLPVPRPAGATLPCSSPAALALGDLDRDARLDLLVTDDIQDSLVGFPGASSGGFGNSLIPQQLLGRRPVDTKVVDLDGDGRDDVLVAYAGDATRQGSLGVLLSSAPPATPTPLPTRTPTHTGTVTPTTTPSVTPTSTATPTPTRTATATRTRSLTPEPTVSPVPTLKPGTFSLSQGCSIGKTRALGLSPLLLGFALPWWRRRRLGSQS